MEGSAGGGLLLLACAGCSESEGRNSSLQLNMSALGVQTMYNLNPEGNRNLCRCAANSKDACQFPVCTLKLKPRE